MVNERQATRRRTWDDLPSAVRDAVGRKVRDQVVGFSPSVGGFSVDAVIGVLSLSGARRLFIKGVPCSHPSVGDYRLEAALLTAIPDVPAMPQLVGVVDAFDWFVVILEALEGSIAHEPWQQRQLAATLDALVVADQATQAVRLDLPTVAERMAGRCETFKRWPGNNVALTDWCLANLERLRALETQWTELVVGDAVLHFDLRHDNCWIRPDGSVAILDWGRACLGPRWVDVVCLLLLSDTGLLDRDSVLTSHPLCAHANSEHVDAFLVALLSYWANAASGITIVGAPQLRQRQVRSRAATEQWLAARWQPPTETL